MDKDTKIVLFFIFVCLIFAGGFHLYRSNVQQQVYARQGVEMTVWEIFWGAVPAERALITKK